MQQEVVQAYLNQPWLECHIVGNLTSPLMWILVSMSIFNSIFLAFTYVYCILGPIRASQNKDANGSKSCRYVMFLYNGGFACFI